jgi:hypothetical protein
VSDRTARIVILGYAVLAVVVRYGLRETGFREQPRSGALAPLDAKDGLLWVGWIGDNPLLGTID